MNELAGRLLLVLGGVVTGLACGELAVRLVGLAPSEVRSFDELRGWRLEPGATGLQRHEGHAEIRINRGGFRGPEAPLHTPDKVVRLAILGDSFAAAMHVPYEDSFCAVTERALSACQTLEGHRAEVLDFGVNGYGTGQELLTLRTQVWQYAPDVVVLALFSGNDVSDNSAALDSGSWLTGERCRPHFRVGDAGLIESDEFRDNPLASGWCRSVFALNRIAIVNYLGEPVLRLRAMTSPPHGPDADLPVHEAGLDDEVYAPPRTPEWDEAWRTTEALVTQVAHEVKARGARFLLVTLSTPIQVYPDPARRGAYLKAVGGTDLFYAEHRLDALAAREGFQVLNLAPALQEYADRERGFVHGFPQTQLGAGHWNALGHRIAGELIARRLCEPAAPETEVRP